MLSARENSYVTEASLCHRKRFPTQASFRHKIRVLSQKQVPVTETSFCNTEKKYEPSTRALLATSCNASKKTCLTNTEYQNKIVKQLIICKKNNKILLLLLGLHTMKIYALSRKILK